MPRRLFLALALIILALAAWPVSAVPSVPTMDEPLADHALGDQLVAIVTSDGAIVIATDDGTTRTALVWCTWPWAEDPRHKNTPELFVTRAREGDIQGERGFDPHADDDDDGLIDEDRLDGRDNDGDDLIDEDFAAISHAMTIWDLARDDDSRHLETYHWSYPQLTGFLAARYDAGDDPSVGPLSLTTSGASWVRADEFCHQTDSLTTGPLFLTAVTDPGDSDRTLWVGVVLLDDQTRRSASERVRATTTELVVPALDGSQALALAAGPTRLRVMHDLAAAGRLRDGMRDPVSGQQVPWLPAPLPPVMAANLPAATLRPAGQEGFDLLLEYGPGQDLRFDPDLFRLDGVPLGAATNLIWAPLDGPVESMTWPPNPHDVIDICHPYDELAVTDAGSLEIQFSGTMPVMGQILEGTLVDGRPAALSVTLAVAAVEPTVAIEPVEESDDGRLQLSPLLLSNYPNPFRSSTRITYQIPATMGEAFAWDEDDEPPFEPSLRMPYAGGGATSSVTIYSLEGREIAVLFSGILGTGSYHAQWDGRDRTGRIMASGAYFCKLQIENWTVTKRLVFVR